MPKRLRQYAALPWREGGHGIEVLLITSRETKRWVIPKGWPIAGLGAPQSAAREAFEEAGVGGIVSSKPLGTYAYDKRLKDGEAVPVGVDVYGLEVMIRHRNFPEMGQREETWVTTSRAAAMVDEAGLKTIIKTLKRKH